MYKQISQAYKLLYYNYVLYMYVGSCCINYYCLLLNLQFFYAIASTKSSNIIVLCMAEIMVRFSYNILAK